MSAVDQRVDQMGVDILDLAHSPQIAQGMPHLFGVDGAVIDAADARRPDLAVDQRTHDALVHQPAEHHLGNIKAGVVGDAQTFHKERLQAKPLLVGGDGLSAAMDDDREVALRLEQAHSRHQTGQESAVIQFIAADLDDHRVSSRRSIFVRFR